LEKCTEGKILNISRIPVDAELYTIVTLVKEELNKFIIPTDIRHINRFNLKIGDEISIKFNTEVFLNILRCEKHTIKELATYGKDGYEPHVDFTSEQEKYYYIHFLHKKN